MRLLALLVTALTILPSIPAEAGNSYWGSWRRWPWRNGTREVLTQVGGHSYASSSARKAIDVAMRYESVHSASPGLVYDVGNGGKTGTFVMVEVDDGTYFTYEHLDRAQAKIGDSVLLGDPIAISGNSGNSTGPHLHFQRSSTSSFSSNAQTLFPISGAHSASANSTITSDNAGIGRTSSNQTYGAMRRFYTGWGGYSSVGVPVAIAYNWMPCQARGINSTRWMYKCEKGFVQTFQVGNEWQTLMAKEGSTWAWIVPENFLAAYTEIYAGKDWVSIIGYPTSLASQLQPGQWIQHFEDGIMTVNDTTCTTTIQHTSGSARYVGYC